MENEIVQQPDPAPTLRETLEANVAASEAGTLETPEQVRARDDAGRFARVEKPVQAPVVDPAQQQAQAPIRPTTWRKEYLPMWDKLATGQPLNPDEAKKLAEYTQQRENEYKTGVSTYKAEAMQAKEVQEAMAPFMPELQARGMKAGDWIKQLGMANLVLIKGTPQQKIQMFQNLAQAYGVPLAAVQQQPGAVPQGVAQLLQIIDGMRNKIEGLEGKVSGVTGFQTQVETKMLENEVQKLAGNPEKYPHFDAVREQMAQLLERGLAPDLETAYDQAIYFNPEVRAQLLTAAQQPARGQVAAQARARAVSPKSVTPSGQVKTTTDAKDRRALIAEQIEALGSGRV